MRIVFMGTPAFAVPCLKALVKSGMDVAGVFTQPDRPKGRGNKLAPSPVKLAAEEAGIPVFQPERIRRDGVEDLKKLKPDLCVTAAFGQLLSADNLAVPRLGTINVHASLLPRHRGSAPVHWSILMGDQVTGVTTMMMDEGIDTGDILVIHDTGAHGYSMGYNYNGRMRHAELLLKEDGTVQMIRRSETPSDYFRTFDFCGILDKYIDKK